MVFPDLPFDEYQNCAFQASKSREMTYAVLSLAYGTFFVLSAVHPPTPDTFCVKDVLALVIIVYSAKRHAGGSALVDGVPSLLEKILQDATTYFLFLTTGHVLFLSFEVFAPVSNPVDLHSTTHDKSHTGSDENSSWVVSRYPKYRNDGGSDGTRSYPQRGGDVSVACRIKPTRVVD